MLRLLALLFLVLACQANDPSRMYDAPRMASVVLFNPLLNSEAFCGATKLRGGRYVTARHCIKNAEKAGDYVAEAIDANDYSSSVYLEFIEKDRDVAYLTGEKNPQGVNIGKLVNGKVELITNQPYRLLRRKGEALLIDDPLPVYAFPGDPNPVLLQHIAKVERPCIKGESGSGVFQFGHVVAVVTAGNFHQCYITGLVP